MKIKKKAYWRKNIKNSVTGRKYIVSLCLFGFGVACEKNGLTLKKKVIIRTELLATKWIIIIERINHIYERIIKNIIHHIGCEFILYIYTLCVRVKF